MLYEYFDMSIKVNLPLYFFIHLFGLFSVLSFWDSFLNIAQASLKLKLFLPLSFSQVQDSRLDASGLALPHVF